MNAARKTNDVSKGADAEERVRKYFLSLGYFVVRGVRFQFNGFDVTDVDLWIYQRPSPLSRERINVDIKNKRTPQALERVFWAKGLQDVLGLDGCIVATTDQRSDVKQFGLDHGVTVMDGDFLQRLQRSGKSQIDRLPEESLAKLLDDASFGKLGGDWRGRFEVGKSRLLSALNFDGANAALNDIKYCLEQAIQLRGNPDELAAWRLLYIHCALFLITLDFALKDVATAEVDQRRVFLIEGFRYGRAGRQFADRVSQLAGRLVYGASQNQAQSRAVSDELERQAREIPAEILADFFAQTSTISGLFDVAKTFEAQAYMPVAIAPGSLPTAARSALAVIVDFLALDRRKVLV